MMLKVEHEHEHVSIDATYLCLNGLNKAGAGLCSLRDRDGNEDTWLAMVLLSNLSFSSLRLFVFAASSGSTSFLGRPRALFLFGELGAPLLGELGAPVSFWELDVSGSLEPSGLLTNCTSSSEPSGRTACWASYTSFCIRESAALVLIMRLMK